MTEVMYCNQPFNQGQRRSGSIGKPFGDVRIRLEDPDGNEVPTGEVGEIVVHSGGDTGLLERSRKHEAGTQRRRDAYG
jgi:acyl-coenzyme A synthetase/AMP-(fatty) acid ligase